MLELYRASAGSGKTYTLAKKYIWYFLTITPEGEATRLRTDSELTDSARHILAVTFTNKATNEMQQRIVEALYDLATIKTREKILADGTAVKILPDYMEEFCDSLNIEQRELAHTAATGLSILLENYSDFNVATIDSFFQTVLRTFAYESELNDTYQVEIDGQFLSQMGVDATLEEIDSNLKDSTTSFWIRHLIDRTEKGKWNMFIHPETDSKNRTENPYGDLIESVKRMENEQYKLIRREIEEYFEKYGDHLPELYLELQQKYEKPVKESFRNMQALARRARAALPDELKTAGPRAALGKPDMYFRNLSGRGSVKLKWDTNPDTGKIPEFNDSVTEGKPWKKWAAGNPDDEEVVLNSIREVQDAVEKWTNLTSSVGFLHWKLYSRWLPYFALFSIVARKRQEYLDDNNAIELGETSMILRSVIGDSDAPFIYERLGTHLNHFLIDEFQDTSRMQWDNLSPLLHESLGRDNGNLIIGDAKQSIYRFRNADPSLITEVVPAEFANRIETRGDVPSENTNYRSDLRIVQFNNSFFEYLARRLDETVGDTTRMQFKELYGNVVQTPDKKEPEGYVELHVFEDNKTNPASQVPQLIQNLLDRGFLQREIAILVDMHQQGEDVIKEIVEYNSRLTDDTKKIRFVSEQSLKVSSSQAVNIITGVLENLARGSNPQINSEEDLRKKGVGNWHEHIANYRYFTLDNKYEDNAATLDAYIESGAEFNALSDLLANMQSFAIPSVVEAVTARFVNEDLRKSDAVYIAAFQDLVLEYCEGHPTDIGSFLKWWERKRKSASIASPKDSDAVQVITVHKSKGLQYECVILPFANWKFSDSTITKAEWRWVEPAIESDSDIPLPPYLPVETSSSLSSTMHAPLLTDFYDRVRMDRLNAAYVAFTRAKKEMYILSSAKRGKNEESIASFLMEFLESEATKATSDITKLPGDVIEIEREPFSAYVGEPVKEIGKWRKPQTAPKILEEYNGIEKPTSLKYRLTELSSLADAGEQEEADAEDIDIRSEGNLKHAVLEHVEVPEDLHKSVIRLVSDGTIPSSLAASIEKDLEQALARPEVARWFDGSAKVLNERPVLKRGYVTRRPDRLLVYPDGKAVVVDYKFGKIPTDKKHFNQIKRYVTLLRETGKFHKVEGYLWYVNEDSIIPVV
ncbi:MAG: UvrD-helicase domain-containing protein [Bacteroides sp.]|nr:UvrD-helicase domain-containing protein [Bacteroides sp.]